MPKRYENKRHLAWVHDFPCVLRADGKCSGGVQAHHLLKPWEGPRGMSLKASDRNLIPLCMAHHTALHMRGNEKAFFSEVIGDDEFGQIIAKALWFLSPHNMDGIG